MEENTEIPYLTNPEADPAVAPLQAAACTNVSRWAPGGDKKC